MVFPLSYRPAALVTRSVTGHPISCACIERSRSHYQASSSHSAGSADVGKPHPKKGQVRAKSIGSALSSLTIQPLKRSSKGGEQSWTSGIVCTEENCSYKADSQTLSWLKDLFDGLDVDRDGAITKRDLKTLICQTNRHLAPVALDWLSEAQLGQTFDQYDADHSGDISFDEFTHMYEDGHMLAVQLAKYKLVFDEVDTSGNGTLGAGELQHFFQKIGQPLSGTQELHELFSKYDTNHSGQLEFNEFLVLFKERLTDIQKTLNYISLKPAKSKATAPSVMEVTPGVVSPVYSDLEFDHVLKMHADQLVVVCASSTDCKPCRSFEPVFDRFASVYRNVVFLHFYAESNEMTKYLDQVRLKVERHPHFAFFRNGSQQFWFTGANQERFEMYMQQHVTAEENPAAGLGMFAMRAHRAKVGLTRS
ncbi:hypothetical protein ABBQ32_013636 [Trebouxia sp. C0010 RCD-2024]